MASACGHHYVSSTHPVIMSRPAPHFQMKKVFCNAFFAQLFHIDFGHFLGNYKSYAVGGISFKRERVPMIMLRCVLIAPSQSYYHAF